MRLAVGEAVAKCPYCGGLDFLPQDDAAREPPEVVCAKCGGYASRKVLLEQLQDKTPSSSRN